MPFAPHSNESLQNFLAFADLYWPRMGAAILCGALIGLENQIYGKSAGLRTCLMVAIGCCLITIVSIETAFIYGGEPGRISAQIITGIGFIGAGVILVRGGKISGITTASTIFLMAGLGIAAGSGFVVTSIIVGVIAFGILILLKPIDRFIDNNPYFLALRESDRAHARAKRRIGQVTKLAQEIESPRE